MKPTELLERISTLFVQGEADILGAFADDAVASDGSTDLAPVGIVDHLKALSPTILHATHDPSSLTVLLESVDEVSGLSVRESWSFLFEAGLVKTALFCCGGSLIQTRRALIYPMLEPYLAGFGFHFPDADDQSLINRAGAIVSTHQGREAIFEHNDALLNDEVVYIPYGWIGCTGFLVSQVTWTAIPLGSGIPLHVHIWAYYRCFADGDTSADRPNDLVISMVKDPTATRRALRRIGNVPDLDQLPVRFRNVDLYFSREALWKAELRGDFRFYIEPPSGAA